MGKLSQTVDAASGQFILDSLGSNGGEVVLLRSLFVTTWVSALTLLVGTALQPSKPNVSFASELISQLLALAPWSAALFGAAYLSFYSRFVSQWSYLANVYNLIKQAEAAGGAKSEVIAEWKAGFLEDADHLHLVEKKSLAPIIANWGTAQPVVDAFVAGTPGGARRLDRIVRCAKAVCHSVEAAELRKPA